MYDVVADDGTLLEDVFAYSNGRGRDRSLIVYHNRFGAAAGWIRDSVPFAVKRANGSKTKRRDTLAHALAFHGPEDGWLRYRDRRSGLESLRSLGEIRSRGWFVSLEAYGCLVIDDLREIVSTADEPWATLAMELGGRGIASLDVAMADRRLRPIHDAVRALLTISGADETAARRADLARLAGLPEAPAVIVPPATADRAVRAAVLLAPLDRARFDELRLATPLGWMGFDGLDVARTRLAICLDHPGTTRDAAALAQRWVADPNVRAFLDVHDWDGAEWMVRERWEELLGLADGLDRANGAKRRSPAIARLRLAGERAGYRLDGIATELAQLASRPPTSSRSVGPGMRRRR
jgi:hypothetical protein